jgi:hypothetical protein
VKYRLLSPALFFNLLIEFFDIVMMRKSMLGIKRRAEAMPRSTVAGLMDNRDHKLPL